MWESFFLLAAILLAAYFCWVTFRKKKASGKKPVPFVCSQCGDRDCVCHRNAADED